MVVEGVYSDPMPLKNMVWQGSVLGPLLWNTFYGDARKPLNTAGATEIDFADDLNGFGVFPAAMQNEDILARLLEYQTGLHAWGTANRVDFDPAKEHFVALHRRDPHGANFVLLRLSTTVNFG